MAYLTMRGHDPKTRDLDECMRAMVYICERLCAALPPKEIQVRLRTFHGPCFSKLDGLPY